MAYRTKEPSTKEAPGSGELLSSAGSATRQCPCHVKPMHAVMIRRPLFFPLVTHQAFIMFEAFADTGNHPLNIPQIASAACLLAWLTFSAIKLLVYHWQEWSRPGRIKLPDNDGATRDVTRKAALYRQLMGYIAADLQDDGELVDEVGFWRQVSHSCVAVAHKSATDCVRFELDV